MSGLRSPCLTAALAAALLCLAGVCATARAADLPCGPVEAGSIHIDGLTSDWDGVQSVELQGQPALGARPLVARVRCNYDEAAVYLLVDVDDDIVARTPAAGPAEDHLELAFLGAGDKVARLGLWPRYRKVPFRARWLSGSGPAVVEGEGPAGRVRRGPPAFEEYDSLQQTGYALELRLPLRLLPGYRRGAPLPLGVRVVDGDSTASPRVAAVAETGALEGPGGLWRVQFAAVEQIMTSLYDDLQLTPASLSFEGHGDLGRGAGRVLVIGRFLAVVVNQEYAFKQIAPAGESIKDVRLIAVPGGHAAAIRTSEEGGGGSREILRLYRCSQSAPDGFQTLLSTEVGKQAGAFQLRTQVTYVPRGGGTEVVLAPQPPVGFTQDNYTEAPATDVIPILLPWVKADRRARYVLRGGVYARAE